MLRKLRIAVLLLILLCVALGTWLDRVYSTDWDGPLLVALYPVAADDSSTAAKYIANMSQEDWQPLTNFFDEEARRYDLTLERPVRFALGAPLTSRPPALGTDAGILQVMLWSLRLRFWAWRTPQPLDDLTPDIRLFLLFHDPERSSRLPHSVGLQKGLLGLAHLFATDSMHGSNQVVIAHELLHTLGATDKYDLATTLPLYPDGYAEPELQPRHPQRFAELMAGRIPDSPTEARMPESLDQVLIGASTTAEIGWSARTGN